MNKQWRPLTDSRNYHDGKFLNLSDTPAIAAGIPLWKIFYELFTRPASVRPSRPLPSVRTDLKSLKSETPVIIWFGHSSYLIHCRGINILVDPVFSGFASPLPGMIKAFPGADIYKPGDMPSIDILLLTHNHYDHLDKDTIVKLAPLVKSCYTALGVGKTIAGFGLNEDLITEMDWWETQRPGPDMELTATPARHFSGRGPKRAGSLWTSFVLKIHGYTLFLGGDSGYDTHFKKIGDLFGPFDLAILECGQYNTTWPYIHMMPEETVQAGIDLRAKVLMPVHWAKFTLANHPWNEPIQRFTKKANELNIPCTTPMIGEPVILGTPLPYDTWWNAG